MFVRSRRWPERQQEHIRRYYRELKILQKLERKRFYEKFSCGNYGYELQQNRERTGRRLLCLLTEEEIFMCKALAEIKHRSIAKW